MNQRPFVRKVVYLVLIAALLAPLAWLSQPATLQRPGGQLAQLRDRYGLGQANLGEIDPTSETLKLATLGMRGVATTILWDRVDEYKKNEDWTRMSATLEQLAHLQPNYVGVWIFQGWNLSFNVSAEWDDYRDRYFWVMQGIKFLQKGTQYNQNEPRLLHEIGYVTSEKIGHSDERVQFRRLFREDDDFHKHQWVKQRNNFLFGKEYFLEAQRVVDNLGVPPKGIGEVVFHMKPAMAQIKYAEALEQDGTFGEQARLAWQRGGAEWKDYGLREFATASGQRYRLADLEMTETRLDEVIAELQALAPGLRERLQQQKLARLPGEQRRAYETNPLARTDEEKRLAAAAEYSIYVSEKEFAQAIDDTARRRRGLELADVIARLREKVHETRQSREHVANYDYWELRCQMEATDDALAARQAIYEAGVALAQESDFWTARRKFEEGFARWRKVLNAYPRMLTDQTAYEMADRIGDYEFVLKQLDEPFPQQFILPELLPLRQPGR